MLRSIYSGDITTIILNLLVSLFVVFCTLPVHEYAHAFVANKLGDGTAKWSGRMTLNPMKHIDPIGALMIVLFGVGWAKPVPINPRNFKNYKRDTALTAAAGPISNVIMAFIYLIVENAIFYISIASGAVIRTGSFIFVLCLFFTLAAQINLSLAVFNLLPIPPLDGSRLFGALLPGKWYYKILQYENVIRIVLICALLFGALSGVIGFLSIIYTRD